jgi:[acyl-carrier-protein] S-malonyltransferase
MIYPGQGSQRVGMGGELRAEDPVLYERWLRAAADMSGLPIGQYCQDGPQETLTRTEVAQPALFAVSLALTDYARSKGIEAAMVAGHSLGEYTSAVACGCLSPEDGLRLVCERGRLMAQFQAERPGSMAAVLGLAAERLQELCDHASGDETVVIANLNSPSQMVVSGDQAAVERLVGLVQAEKGAKAIRLQTGAAFHSPLMQPVQHRLACFMDGLTWNDARVALVANASASALTAAADIRQALIDQIASPVRWSGCVSTLLRSGCDTFLELGPGRVLSGLVKQIAPNATVFAADSPSKVREFLAG